MKVTVRRHDFINTQIDLTFDQRARAVKLEDNVSTDEYATAAEIIALRDALVHAVLVCHGHAYNCSAARGMERDCHCGWLEVKQLARSYEVKK